MSTIIWIAITILFAAIVWLFRIAACLTIDTKEIKKDLVAVCVLMFEHDRIHKK